MAISQSLGFLLFCFLNLRSSGASSTPSPTIASEQIKFWSQNVKNQMPKSIMNKLSPLTKKDCDFYGNNDKFIADTKFCSLAKLACNSAFDSAKVVSKMYTTTKTYGNSAVFHAEKAKQDPFSFFRVSMLRRGHPIHLPHLEESLPDGAFLPPDIASRISLSSTDNILKIFTASTSKMTKQNIETSLSYCNAEAIEGEAKSCLKSLEEMIMFSKSALGLGGEKLVAMTSQSTRGSNAEMMVKNVKKIGADKIVACHQIFLPFATYFCHTLYLTNLYEVELVCPNSASLANTMLAICHLDTSPWPANHAAFQILKFGPGQGEACHWVTQLDLVWIA